MSGQIFYPNFTGNGVDSEIQSGWRYETRDCFRPASDFAIPIICVATHFITTSNSSLFDTDPGTEYNAVYPCCPRPTEGSSLNMYVASAYCRQEACFTSDETVAKGFEECVKKQAALTFEELKADGKVPRNETIRYVPTGRCEYIDYEMLKKGIQKGGAQSHNVFSLQALLITSLGLFLFGSGIF